MYVIKKQLEDITKVDLQSLIDEKRIEKKVLDINQNYLGIVILRKKNF